ncbi:MAG: cellobiose phosphorylase [Caldilineaceae bacterium]|nr:cellobiose phosphorylase [Caldilineaceae bacterium]MBP8109426.1 cellobiose phosphorylase [Caldilineaceae bacterium]MBP8121878.1 cellobiose phosphorylase [Caldilineaceae bacterium]MBP9073157.1 cellobiose phosphorylase [Caldilineaceae bacterium]
MNHPQPSGWQFIDEAGTFRLAEADKTSYLYFPLMNEAGIFASVSPRLAGDITSGHNSFLTEPVSVEDLHASRAGRNFWVGVAGRTPWSAAGNGVTQIARRGTESGDDVTVEAGFLWHRVIRENAERGLRAEVTNFVPIGPDKVELMQVRLTNTGPDAITVTPTAAIPLYGRSADNLRDHRHVTSLLHRTRTEAHGVTVTPTLSFDERGHMVNTLTYGVLGASGDGSAPIGFFPVIEDFIGEGGTLDWPEAIVADLPPSHKAGAQIDGYETLGGLRFAAITLAPGQSADYVLILEIMEPGKSTADLLARYGDGAKFAAALAATETHWAAKLDTVGVTTGDHRFDGWMRWVSLQPILRRLAGNSFLPYHDYGRGGRGWRDLWQDILALLFMESDKVGEMLFANFAGVRFDGSNATIIGSKPGEFKADRNNIPRTWMDHGAWPFQTTQFYMDQTGDLAFLLREQGYFKDRFVDRAKATDPDWSPDQGTTLARLNGQPYRGTVLEHILIQHLTAFFNVGDHNNIKLEDADWNDGLDMAHGKGESVAFTAFYAGNLAQLSVTVRALARLGVDQVDVAEELLVLLDSVSGGEAVDYGSVAAKRARLADYFATCRHTVSGRKVAVSLADLAGDLTTKAEWLKHHIRTQEWISDSAGHSWFNGYYNNDGDRVEGDHPLGVRMTLTGQVFPLMAGVATDAQAESMLETAQAYLLDESVGGYRLNTNFGEVQLNLGRAFGFAFGHKENGAMFSHMAVMFAYALYQRGMVQAGHKALNGLYAHCQEFAVSRMYPGLPEYTSDRGRGMYPFLTGSASWYLLTMVTQVFGVRGHLGDLVLDPKLVAEQFDDEGRATLRTRFAGVDLDVVYHNPDGLDHGAYRIGGVRVDGVDVAWADHPSGVVIDRSVLAGLDGAGVHRLDVNLGE